MSSTRDAQVGDVISFGNNRVEVIANAPDGVTVSWYRDGVGPFQAILPHASTYHRLYENEAQGLRASWWDYHPDITGQYGDI